MRLKLHPEVPHHMDFIWDDGEFSSHHQYFTTTPESHLTVSYQPEGDNAALAMIIWDSMSFYFYEDHISVHEFATGTFSRPLITTGDVVKGSTKDALHRIVCDSKTVYIDSTLGAAHLQMTIARHPAPGLIQEAAHRTTLEFDCMDPPEELGKLVYITSESL